MCIIELDAAGWTSVLDFYGAILAALGAPEWHGKNINALVDSMVWGGINTLEPPYTIRIRNLMQAPKDAIDEVRLAKVAIVESRRDFSARRGDDVDVQLEIVYSA